MKQLNVHFAVMIAGNGIVLMSEDALDAHIDDRELKVSPSIAVMSRGPVEPADKLEGDRAALMVLRSALQVAQMQVSQRLLELGIGGGEQVQAIVVDGPGGAKA